MCVNVARFETGGRMVEAPCRKCWQCRANRVHDWVGRCIAEKEHAAAASFVTLTYGASLQYGSAVDAPGAQVFRYSDVQAWIRKFRDAGFPCRFVVASEMGARKGRIHHHAILFWQDAIPTLGDGRPMPDGVYQDSDPWWVDADGNSRGRTQWDPVTPKAIRYVAKYILKPDGVGAASMFRMSKKPAIGARYFMERADRFVAQQLSPQTAIYQFPEYKGRDGRPRPLMMTKATRDLFVRHFVNSWKAAYGSRPWPASELVEAYDERIKPPDPADPFVAADPASAGRRYREQVEDRIERLGREVRLREPVRVKPPGFFPEGCTRVRFDEPRNLWVCELNGQRLVWSFDEAGAPAWVPKVTRPGLRSVQADLDTGAQPEPIRLGRRGKRPSKAERAAERDADRYHVAMLESRMSAISDMLKRNKDGATASRGRVVAKQVRK